MPTPVGSGRIDSRAVRRRTSRTLKLNRPKRVPLAPLAAGAMASSWVKEDLSVAYAEATGTAVGVTCESLKRDINGWDVLFRARDTPDADGAALAVQLKCTENRLARVAGGREVSFPVNRETWDYLRKVPAHPPRLLVVVEVFNSHPPRWVEHSHANLLLNASAWWATVRGSPALPDGQMSTTIRIPVTQRFTPRALLANMRSAS